MDLMLLGSEISTNSLLELLTVYTAVPARLLATWSELIAPVKSRLAGRASCDKDANGKELSGRERFSAGGVQLPASRLVSSRRLASSAPSRRQCWWMKVENDSRGLEGLGVSMVRDVSEDQTVPFGFDFDIYDTVVSKRGEADTPPSSDFTCL